MERIRELRERRSTSREQVSDIEPIKSFKREKMREEASKNFYYRIGEEIVLAQKRGRTND